MSDQALKNYYASYARALELLRHPGKATPGTLAACVKQAGNSSFNRLFCLAVRRELKLQAEGRPSMPREQYKPAVTDIWRLFKAHIDGDGSDAFWDSLVDGLGEIITRYGHCQLIVDLAIHVVLETIEAAVKEKGDMKSTDVRHT